MIRNYFADLELEVSAGLQEVKNAYRRLAKKFHPDLNPEDPLADQAFRRIQEAYEHLNTGTKISRLKGRLSKIRSLENSSITKWKERRVSEAPAEKKDRGRTTAAKAKRQEDLDIRIQLTVQPRVLENGGKERFQFVFEKPCSVCDGKGGSRHSVMATCKKCAGLGTTMISRGALQWKKTCDGCYGKGFQVIDPCVGCSGKGKVAERQAVEVQIPKGIDLHQEVRLSGLGHISFDGKKRGDLWLTLAIKV